MKIGGIASTMTTDTDGETLDPRGFVLDYFLKSGYLNWNHGAKDPSAFVGRPTKASIKEGQLNIEGYLFDDSERAQEVYKLAEILEKEGLNLGFSIEGIALERGSTDKNNILYKNVTKALITGCAITPNPKNAGTIANIIKGNSFGKLGEELEEDEDEDDSQEGVEKAMTAEGSSGQALSKESLNKDTKVTTFESKEPKNKKNLLTKGDVYGQIMNKYPNLDTISVDRVYQLAQEINKKENMEKISDDAFEKALAVVNELQSAELSEDDVLEKGSSKKPLMKKMETSSEESDEDEDEEDEENDDDRMEKGFTPNLDQIEAAQTILEASGAYVVLSKEDYEDTLQKGMQSNLFEQEEEKESAPDIDLIIKGLSSSDFGKNVNAIPSLGLLVKGLNDQMKTMSDKLDIIGTNSPGPKSVLKTNFLEKGLGDNHLAPQEQESIQTLSLSANRKQILDELEAGCMSPDGNSVLNKGLADSLMMYESSGMIDPNITSFFKAKKVVLTR